MSERADKDLALREDFAKLQKRLDQEVGALEARLSDVESALATEQQARSDSCDALVADLDAERAQRAEADTALARRLQEYQSRG